MSFLPIILLAVVAFAIGALALKLPRSGWAIVGAALMFGLAGYALQGSPGQAGSPKSSVADRGTEGTALVEARREIYGPAPPSRYVTVADGFARRGQFADAAGILRSSLAGSPDDPEARLALANALVEHAVQGASIAYSAASERTNSPGATRLLVSLPIAAGGTCGFLHAEFLQESSSMLSTSSLRHASTRSDRLLTSNRSLSARTCWLMRDSDTPSSAAIDFSGRRLSIPSSTAISRADSS